MNGTSVLHVAKVAGISGSEASLLALLPALRERGWDVRFLMLHQHEPGAWDFARALRERGVPLDALPIRRDVDPITFGRLARHLARTRPAILHTHLVHGDIYGLPAGAATGVPVRISTKHGFNEFRERKGFAVSDRTVGKLATVHIAISRGLARYLADVEGFDEETFEIVHYGIEAGPEPPPYDGQGLRLLCIGRLIPIKGHIVLLRAFALARRELPDLRLDIAGRGPLENALRALALELGIADAVTFLGQVAPIQTAIEQAAAVVVPSLGEGFGMVALESMERGRPVVAAAVGGLAEIVLDGETGILVPSGEVAPLAAAIVRLGRDPELTARMGRAGRERAVADFPQERATDRTDALYRAALDRSYTSRVRSIIRATENSRRARV